jgi:hypothetical protein
VCCVSAARGMCLFGPQTRRPTNDEVSSWDAAIVTGMTRQGYSSTFIDCIVHYYDSHLDQWGAVTGPMALTVAANQACESDRTPSDHH